MEESTLGSMHCPKSHPNFHDITWNVVENMILLEKFRVNHVLPATVHVISRKNWFSLWQCGCFRKMDNPLVHTTPNHHHPKMDVLPKTFLQISEAFKYVPQTAATTFHFSSVCFFFYHFSSPSFPLQLCLPSYSVKNCRGIKNKSEK